MARTVPFDSSRSISYYVTTSNLLKAISQNHQIFDNRLEPCGPQQTWFCCNISFYRIFRSQKMRIVVQQFRLVMEFQLGISIVNVGYKYPSKIILHRIRKIQKREDEFQVYSKCIAKNLARDDPLKAELTCDPICLCLQKYYTSIFQGT